MRAKKTRRANTQRRALCLHGRFMPPGTNRNDEIDSFTEFVELFCEARDLKLKRRRRELRNRKRGLKKQAPLISKVGKILQEHLADEIDQEETARRIRRICPDDKTARSLLDFFSSPPKKSLPSEAQLIREKARIDRSERILRSWTQASRHIEILATHANTGDADAITNLAELGHHVVQFLLVAKRIHPEVVRSVSKSQGLWPLLVSAKSSWEKDAARQLEGLELARNLEILQVRFTSLRGSDENYPPRQWAKAAIRTLEETRRRVMTYGEYREEFQHIIFAGKAKLAETPLWAGAACRLPFLSTETVPAWAKVIRDMIRQELPDFHTRPEWQNQRNTATHSGRNTAGEIRNAILDDIISALKRIAPRAILPKSIS